VHTGTSITAPNPTTVANIRLPTDVHIQRQLLLKELMVGVSSEKHALFHEHRRPSVAEDLTSSGREQHSVTFSAPVSPHTICPCDVCVIAAPLHRQQTTPGLSLDGTTGLSHQV